MMFGAKDSVDSYMPPSIWMPNRVENFLEVTARLSNEEFIKHFEAFSVQGGSGVAQSGRKVHAQVKKEITAMLVRSLRKWGSDLL